MKRIGFVLFALIVCVIVAATGMGLAAGVPPVTAGDFGGVASPEAHPVWLILAGEGFWGAIIIGIAGFVYRVARPYVIAWMEEKKLSRLYLAIEAYVAKNNVDYVEGMKAANADGKLTEEEAAEVFRKCKQNLADFMLSQGTDIIKEYGDAFVDALIELLVSRMKNPLAKAVAVPLPESSASAPLPPSVTDGVLPG